MSQKYFLPSPFLQKHLPFLLILLKNIWNPQWVLSLYVSGIMITCAVTTGVCRHSYISHDKSGKCYLNKVAILTKVYSVEIVILIVWCNKQFSWHSIFSLGVLKYEVTVDTTKKKDHQRMQFKQANNEQKTTKKPLCTGEKLSWPCIPSSTFQINWKLKLL